MGIVGRQQRRIRIHVVHESRMVAEALSVTLKSLLPRASVDGWTKSWETYLGRATGVADVVVIDNELSNGVPTPAKVGTLTKDGTGVVVFGATKYGPAIRRVLDAGANAYLLPNEPTSVVAEAIESAFRNERFESPGLEQIFAQEHDRRVPGLTPRELEVVSVYLSGASVPETAARFGLSAETVRTHISHTRRKYSAADGASISKMELRRRMINDGWILQ